MITSVGMERLEEAIPGHIEVIDTWFVGLLSTAEVRSMKRSLRKVRDNVALLFVLFDVEAVFIFPFATRAEAYGWFGFVEMGIFIAILALGLLYAWKKKVLRWI